LFPKLFGQWRERIDTEPWPVTLIEKDAKFLAEFAVSAKLSLQLSCKCRGPWLQVRRPRTIIAVAVADENIESER
jgi:hypothetical protein